MTATAAPSGRSRDALDRATLVVGGVVILCAIMSILDATIVNIALDDLSRDLDAPLSLLPAVVLARSEPARGVVRSIRRGRAGPTQGRP